MSASAFCPWIIVMPNDLLICIIIVIFILLVKTPCTFNTILHTVGCLNPLPYSI